MSIYISKSEKFYDGQTSKSQTVSVMLSGSTLQLQSEHKEIIQSWSLQNVQIIDHPSPPAPAVLGYQKTPKARLEIADEKGWKYLKTQINKKGHKSGRILPTHWSSFGTYGLVAILSITFIILLFPKVLGTMSYIIPLSWEKELGKQVTLSLTQGENACTATAGTEILTTLTNHLKTNMKREVSYNVYIIDNPYVMNAFAAPGGYILIYRKVIDKAESPEELAGVLAHEMAHIELYHTTESMIRDLGIGFTLSMIFGDGGAIVGDVAQFLSRMSYSRQDEEEADAHAVKTLTQLGISPTGLRDFLTRIKDEEFHIEFEGYEFLEYLSTHPDTDKRINAIKTDKITQMQPALSKEKWSAMRSICDQTTPIEILLK